GRDDPSAAWAQRVRAQEHPSGGAALDHLQGGAAVLRDGSVQARLDGVVPGDHPLAPFDDGPLRRRPSNHEDSRRHGVFKTAAASLWLAYLIFLASLVVCRSLNRKGSGRLIRARRVDIRFGFSRAKMRKPEDESR